MPSRVQRLLAVQAIGATIASAIIIYIWLDASTLVCLDSCSKARVAQVNLEAVGFAAILSVIAGLVFLAPSWSVRRRIR